MRFGVPMVVVAVAPLVIQFLTLLAPPPAAAGACWGVASGGGCSDRRPAPRENRRPHRDRHHRRGEGGGVGQLTGTTKKAKATSTTRREALVASVSGILAVTAATTASRPPPATAASAADGGGGELPMALRDYTKLAPLGAAGGTDSPSTKSYHLPLDEMARRLTNDLVRGATENRGGYVVTGDISQDLFRDDCIFVDPTNRVVGLAPYRRALTILFDPDRSVVEIVEPLKVDETSNMIRGKFRSRGFLQLPWNPYVSSYESTIEYVVDDETGLISEQRQRWTKSAREALQETFTPTIFTPPPKSPYVEAPRDEPGAVSDLFDRVNGRRPNEYSDEERSEIDALIGRIANAGNADNFDSRLLPGRWMSVYLQPGPDGATFDRRVPFFPELPFNDNYQIFRSDRSVTNIGELWGPYLDVRVSGAFEELGSSGGSRRQPLRANIQGGGLCASTNRGATLLSCLDLPMIKGEGLFESVYLGQRLRIGQNLNGGGARVVQVRIADE